MNLVTGGTGLLGAHVLLTLTQKGQRVRALYRSEQSKNEVLSLFQFHQNESSYSLIEWVKGDVLDIPSLESALTGVLGVFHCAAVVSYHKKDRQQMYTTNVEGTSNVVNLCIELGISKLVHISSIAAIGRTDSDATLDENSPWIDSPNNTHYGITKNLSEMEVWRGVQEGLNAVVINPGFIIGPGNFDRSSASVFTRIREGLPAFPSGGTGFVSVNDVCTAMIKSMESDISEQRYILVGENLSMRELFEMIAREISVPIPPRDAQPWMMHTVRILEAIREFFTGKKALVTKETVKNATIRYRYKNDRSIQELGIRYESIEQAVKHTAAYFNGKR